MMLITATGIKDGRRAGFFQQQPMIVVWFDYFSKLVVMDDAHGDDSACALWYVVCSTTAIAGTSTCYHLKDSERHACT